jgi:hypothetical protein
MFLLACNLKSSSNDALSALSSSAACARQREQSTR